MDHAQEFLYSPIVTSRCISPSREDMIRVAAALRAGADPDRHDINGITPAYRVACKQDHQAAVGLTTLFIDLGGMKGVENRAGSLKGTIPIFGACGAGNYALFQLLASKPWGCRTDHVDDLGRSHVHFAAMGRHAQIIEDLVTNPRFAFNPNLPDNEGRTPMMYLLAKESGGAKKICWLISLYVHLGADPNARAKDGDTAVHYALRMSPDMKWPVLRTLLRFSADPEIEGEDGKSLLDHLDEMVRGPGRDAMEAARLLKKIGSGAASQPSRPLIYLAPAP